MRAGKLSEYKKTPKEPLEYLGAESEKIGHCRFQSLFRYI
jgi:hypothetical protein